MEERKNRSDPSHGYQNQTFEEQFAGRFVAERIHAEKETEDAETAETNARKTNLKSMEGETKSNAAAGWSGGVSWVSGLRRIMARRGATDFELRDCCVCIRMTYL